MLRAIRVIISLSNSFIVSYYFLYIYMVFFLRSPPPSYPCAQQQQQQISFLAPSPSPRVRFFSSGFLTAAAAIRTPSKIPSLANTLVCVKQQPLLVRRGGYTIYSRDYIHMQCTCTTAAHARVRRGIKDEKRKRKIQSSFSHGAIVVWLDTSL